MDKSRSATGLFRLHDCRSPIFFLVYLHSVPPDDKNVLLLTLEIPHRTFAYPGPLSIRGMSHFVVEILPANNTGVKMSVATFKEIYILGKYTRPDWFQLTMQFYELPNSGRLNGTLSWGAMFLKIRMNGRTPGWPVSCTKNESFTRLHPQQVAGRPCLECQPLTRAIASTPSAAGRSHNTTCCEVFAVCILAISPYYQNYWSKIIHVLCTTLMKLS